MKQHGVAAYLVPSTDPHQSEYVPDAGSAGAWLSGFTGSAGELVVIVAQAGLWTDGRYFLQAEQQLARERASSSSGWASRSVPACPTGWPARLKPGESRSASIRSVDLAAASPANCERSWPSTRSRSSSCPRTWSTASGPTAREPASTPIEVHCPGGSPARRRRPS